MKLTDYLTGSSENLTPSSDRIKNDEVDKLLN